MPVCVCLCVFVDVFVMCVCMHAHISVFFVKFCRRMLRHVCAFYQPSCYCNKRWHGCTCAKRWTQRISLILPYLRILALDVYFYLPFAFAVLAHRCRCMQLPCLSAKWKRCTLSFLARLRLLPTSMQVSKLSRSYWAWVLVFQTSSQIWLQGYFLDRFPALWFPTKAHYTFNSTRHGLRWGIHYPCLSEV